MNVSLSFNQIIAKCLLDIKEEISSCQEQLDITSQKIAEIEKLQEAKSINDIELGLLVQKLNLLLVDNFCLISKQSKLIEYYTQLMNVMNRSIKGILQKQQIASSQDNSLNELVEYYQRRNRLDIAETLKKYSYTFNQLH